MSKMLTVELPEETYAALEAAAHALGKTTAEVAALRLRYGTSTEKERENAIRRALLEAGLIDELERPPLDVEAFYAFKPLHYEGKPVSETLIEERR
jgi:hypothetical protein